MVTCKIGPTTGDMGDWRCLASVLPQGLLLQATLGVDGGPPGFAGAAVGPFRSSVQRGPLKTESRSVEGWLFWESYPLEKIRIQ